MLLCCLEASQPEATREKALAKERAGVCCLTDGVVNCSGRLYAINMQYGVNGARTNSSANLLVLSLPVSPGVAPRPTDFTVQLAPASQTGNVSVLSNYVSDADFLLRVRPAASCSLHAG